MKKNNLTIIFILTIIAITIVAITIKLFIPSERLLDANQVENITYTENITQECSEEICYIFDSVYCEELAPSAAFVYCEMVDGCPTKQILDYCGDRYCKCETSWSFSYGGEIHNKEYYDDLGVNLKEKETYIIERGAKTETCQISKIYTIGYTRSGDANNYIWALSFCNENK